jgi:hypothetical protein
MEPTHFYQAGIHARYLAETLFRADTIKRYARQDATYHIDTAMDEFRQLADHLGFDLVKREPAKEPAEEAA